MRVLLVRVLLVIVLLAACGKDRAQTCGPDVYDLQQYLKKMDRGLAWLSTSGIELIRRDDLPKKYVPMSPVVHVRPSGIDVLGRTVSGLELSDALLRRPYTRARGYSTDQVVVVVDARAPWEKVVAVAEGAERAGIKRVLFAFAGPPASEPPPRTRIDDDLDVVMKEVGAGERATKLASMFDRLTKSCVPLFKAFRGYGMSNATDDREGRMIDAMAQALLDCDCKVDLGALRSLMYRILATQPITLLDLTLDRYQESTRVELPPGTPWREAQKRLGKQSRTWLALPAPPPEAVPADAGAGSANAE